MKNNNKNNRYYTTSNFYLASFLFSKGLELAGIDKITNPKRASFIFVDNPAREEFVDRFNFAKENDVAVLIDARKFVVAQKTLKDRLYQDSL